MKTLKITFKTDGTPVVEVSGCAGTECHQLTKQIEQGLGTLETDEAKPELYEHETRNHIDY